MPTEKIEFPGALGETLAARLDLPDGPPRAYALFAHCFTCSKDIAAARRIAGRLSALGLGVLRFDFTGLGHSQGEFANTGFSSNVGDLIAAAEWMAREGKAPALMIGHSLGGAAVLAAAGRVPSAKAVATIGAPADPGHVVHNFGAALEEIAAKGEAEVTLQGRAFTIRQDFVEDVRAARLKPLVANLRRALLVLHAPRDATVGIENATELFAAAKHPKSFVTLDDADHLLGRREDADYAAEVIAAWAGRYLDLAPPASASDGAAPEGVVRVTEADPAGFRQDILAGRHPLAVDEPAGVGGTDTAPTPYALLSAALGACTTMTLRMYARRKGWPVAGLSVDVLHDKVHADDCAGCEEGAAGRIDRFERVIRIEGDLTEAQRAKLLEIADKCPVHRTLHGSVEVVTRAA
ncbi:MAG: bifunctional alpha/beta hydrolase/OsmC family protein [Pseudomonadota bacterium]